MDTTKPFDLSRVRSAPAGSIKLTPEGEAHDVKQTTSAQHHYLKTAVAGNAVERVFEVARDVTPTIPAEDHSKMTLKEAQAILGIASGDVAAVEEMYPNADQAAAPTSRA